MSPDHPDWDQYKALKLEAIRAAIGEIQTVKPAEKKEILQAVIADYRAMEHFSRTIEFGAEENRS